MDQRPHSNDRKITGYCPMGCGQTLFVGDEGAITCSLLTCPRPDAVHIILSHRETNHVVVFTDDNFSIRHPLKERCEDELFECSLHGYLHGLSGSPVKPGEYIAVQHEGDRWRFNPVVRN